MKLTIATGIRAHYTEPVFFRMRPQITPATNTAIKTATHGNKAYMPIVLRDRPRARVKYVGSHVV